MTVDLHGHRFGVSGAVDPEARRLAGAARAKLGPTASPEAVVGLVVAMLTAAGGVLVLEAVALRYFGGLVVETVDGGAVESGWVLPAAWRVGIGVLVLEVPPPAAGEA